MKFKEGQQVEVIDNLYGHHFNIGAIITITKCDEKNDTYIIEDNNGIEWYLGEEELKELTPMLDLEDDSNHEVKPIGADLLEISIPLDGVITHWNDNKTEPAYKQEALRIYNENSKLHAVKFINDNHKRGRRLSEIMVELEMFIKQQPVSPSPTTLLLQSILENAVHIGGTDYRISEDVINKIREVLK